MDFTFGIITYKNNEKNIDYIIDSIEKQEMPKYEVVVVGQYNKNRKNTHTIDFDETIKDAWITRKKNLIVKEAQFDKIVFLHDYVFLEPNWYKGFLKFGDEWDICMSVIKNEDNTRFRDWVVFELDGTSNIPVYTFGAELGQPIRYIAPYLPTYDYTDTSKMYISGAYWVAKKKIMEKFPLNENLTWGKAEDIEWSQRVRDKCVYKMNTFSSVKLMKHKDNAWQSINKYHMSKEYINKELYND